MCGQQARVHSLFPGTMHPRSRPILPHPTCAAQPARKRPPLLRASLSSRLAWRHRAGAVTVGASDGVLMSQGPSESSAGSERAGSADGAHAGGAHAGGAHAGGAHAGISAADRSGSGPAACRAVNRRSHACATGSPGDAVKCVTAWFCPQTCCLSNPGRPSAGKCAKTRM